MAGIPRGLWSAYFVSALWCSLWISESSMHLPPHVRLGHGGWRERLIRESLCFNWLLSSNPHAPQSLMAQGNVGSQEETLSYQLSKALCVLVKNEIKKKHSWQGGEEPGPLAPLPTLTQSHPSGKEGRASPGALWTCSVFWIASSGGKLSDPRSGLQWQSTFNSVSVDKCEMQIFICQTWVLSGMSKEELNTAIQSRKLEHSSSIHNQGPIPV